MVRRGWNGLLIVAAMTCGMVAAPRADAADPKGLAELLRAGADATAAKRWSVCADALTAAAALESTPKTLGDLGLCEEQAGRFVAAHDHLFRALEAAPTATTKEPWARYHAALARVKGRIALVNVSTWPPNAKVILDGRPLGAADGRAFAVEPGAHTIAARLSGYEDAVETRTMRAKDAPSFHFQLKRKPMDIGAPVASAPPPGPTREAPSFASLLVPGASPRGVLVGLTYASAATALASWGTSIGLELDRASVGQGLARDACTPIPPGSAGSHVDNSSRPSQCAAIHERVVQRDAATGVAIAATIGTVVFGGLAGVAMVAERRASQPSIAVAASPFGGGFVVMGQW